MNKYRVRIAIDGMSAAWRVTYVMTSSAERAIDLAAAREVAEGYTAMAFQAENVDDAHDNSCRATWPFTAAQ